ncbi:hypothetical protein HDU76_012109 [Blyttiomyces sp. JEL0837]|nr:hypothetical protein HDU76_012109 [Blyttiomyces sp. JEL0837]
MLNKLITQFKTSKWWPHHQQHQQETSQEGEDARRVSVPQLAAAGENSTAESQSKPEETDASSPSKIFFFDIDNCLYHKNTGIYILMGERIRNYFMEMGLSDSEAHRLHKKYYTEYGLAIKGLVKHHKVDPVEYDRVVDGGLPLESLLKPDPELRQMLEDIKGVRRWACTNAGIVHATRVLKILGVTDLFEGITYCDYAEPDFVSKPDPLFYKKAMKEAGVTKIEECYFVDDSESNVDSAKRFGWTTIHVADTLPSKHGHYQITDIHDLPKILPELWPTRTPGWGVPEHGPEGTVETSSEPIASSS